jgi:hypothetical protein
VASKYYPSDIVERARAGVEAWRNIDPLLTFGEIDIPALEADSVEIGEIFAQIDSLETNLIDLRNRRDDLGVALWDKLKRLHAGVKAIYGDDSSEYEMVGGTRLSDRKPVGRKKIVE